MNVLSLFDGMSCGQQALDRLGVKVDNYFASEIDKYAIQVTMANYPNTKQLGSVVNVDGYSLPKIDLLLGGSPCQTFSFAGKRKGMSTKCETEILTLEHYLELKAEGYEFEGQSYLFWEYMRLLNECKPTYFLLENVEMGEKWEKVLSKAIGVNGIHINSALVSAQNRKRIYWTNIGMQPRGLFGDLESIIEQPKDRGILLKDILQDNPNAKYYVSDKLIAKINRSNNADKCLNTNDKSLCLAAGYYKQGRDNQYIPVDEKYFLSEKMIDGFLLHNKRHIEEKNQTGFNWKPTTGNKKGNTLRANAALCPTDNSVIVHNTMPRSSTSGKGVTGPLSRTDGKTNCLDTGNTNAVEVRQVKQISTNNKSNGGTQPYQQDRIYDVDGISPALNTDGRGHAVEVKALNERQKANYKNEDEKANTFLSTSWKGSQANGMTLVGNSRIRRLTPIECERLQTVADNYTNHVSDSQRYKMLGNGWTIDVIAHILKYAF
jgi:DNA (cytosine-5)-methyltransferase 3A